MKCPNCLSKEPLQPISTRLPWYCWPLRAFLASLRCDTCLTIFFRIRVFSLLIRRRNPRELPHIGS